MSNSADFIKNIIKDFSPEIGIVLGSGLSNFTENIKNPIEIFYNDIPDMPVSSVKGHNSKFVIGEIGNKKVIAMAGRIHYYEGYPIEKVVLPIKIMGELGIDKLILTNAAGGVNSGLTSGDLMVITDHINFMGVTPLLGANFNSRKEMFPDMSEIYDKSFIEKIKEQVKKLNFEIKEGVYLATSGPNYETPAEVRMFKTLGADAVGMSTVPEAIYGSSVGMKIIGISCISNMAAGISNSKLSHSEVIETTSLVKEKFQKLLLEILNNVI